MSLTNNIAEALSVLRSGGVIVYPTETTYGIGCDATNSSAVDRVFALKGRSHAKGVTILLPESDRFGDAFVIWNSRLRECAKKHWPGALNIILPAKSGSIIASQCFTNNTLSVRRSSYPIANTLVDALGVPLVSTSANISGEPELYSAQEIFDRFSHEPLQPDLILDVGILHVRPPSTLVAWDDVAESIVVLRRGETHID